MCNLLILRNQMAICGFCGTMWNTTENEYWPELLWAWMHAMKMIRWFQCFYGIIERKEAKTNGLQDSFAFDLSGSWLFSVSFALLIACYLLWAGVWVQPKVEKKRTELCFFLRRSKKPPHKYLESKRLNEMFIRLL